MQSAFAACNSGGEGSAAEVLSTVTNAPAIGIVGDGVFRARYDLRPPHFADLTLIMDQAIAKPLSLQN